MWVEKQRSRFLCPGVNPRASHDVPLLSLTSLRRLLRERRDRTGSSVRRDPDVEGGALSRRVVDTRVSPDTGPTGRGASLDSHSDDRGGLRGFPRSRFPDPDGTLGHTSLLPLRRRWSRGVLSSPFTSPPGHETPVHPVRDLGRTRGRHTPHRYQASFYLPALYNPVPPRDVRTTGLDLSDREDRVGLQVRSSVPEETIF